MKKHLSSLMVVGILALSSCNESNRIYEKHCKIRPANWATEVDHKQRLEHGGIVEPIYNFIKLDETSGLKWNGYPITKEEITTFLKQVNRLDTPPTTILRINGRTPCSFVEDVRKIMLESPTCQRPEKLCTEDDSEPPPPPDIDTDKAKNIKRH
jgi:hypothetical protein